MRYAMTAKDRRTLIGGAMVVGSVIAFGRGIPSWRDWDADRRTQASATLARAAEFDRALRAIPHMADSARISASRYGAAVATLLVEETPAIASARLADLVSGAADDASVKVTSLMIRPDTAFKDRFARVAVRLSATGDIRALVELLDTLEGSETVLSVRELFVTPTEPAGSDSKPEALRFQLLVEALAARPSITTSTKGAK
jgi:hypothetical protein